MVSYKNTPNEWIMVKALLSLSFVFLFLQFSSFSFDMAIYIPWISASDPGQKNALARLPAFCTVFQICRYAR